MDPTEIIVDKIIQSIDGAEDLEQIEQMLNFDYAERLLHLGSMLEKMEFSKLLDLYTRRMRILK